MADVLVIGAGPAGLAAARAARTQGALVTLLDAADDVGGQYWRHLPDNRSSERERVLHHGWAAFTELRRALDRDDHCRVLRSAQVWAIEETDAARRKEAPPAQQASEGELRRTTVHILVGPADGAARERLTLKPDAIVVATGAHDRTLPFPGWELPGVFTAGAAQALAKGERVAVGERVVVAGAGPFLLPVAASLVQTGSAVVGVYEASRSRTLASGWLPRPWLLARAGKKGVELAGYVVRQVRHRIPYRTGTAVVRAHGTDRVTAVTIASVDEQWRPVRGTERRVAADAVCVSHAFTPRLELALAAGCELDDAGFVAVDADQRTSVRDVYAAGEITGIGGVELALAEGTIAGHCAAGGSATDDVLRRPLRARSIYQEFAQRMHAAHSVRPGWTGWLTDDTVVCRCEEVNCGALRAAAAATESSSLRSLKLSTRAGLGICQGRICGRTVEKLLADAGPHGRLRDDARFDRRPIAFPLRLGELATDDQ
ncbi:NAD(P)/FAD-dependent oxidoreductase [Phytoactinopolyspora halotolerans]|uniref:FAD-dependent oxidoreductase n=1 Tax=Phytoactinopolyspora halotolerans TaxID=1981512 RepID=A0A6L9SGY7_9ACTN|nr:FAD/NAD(P)-binding oxidoreductase [Phytoactinopolyspora halotolerans]NEE03350.1 FAD-dependent oxidoreductase [Phytoactinopolyspora halotolerans]